MVFEKIKDFKEKMKKEKNWTNRTDEPYGSDQPNLIPPHGGYRNLKSYQNAVIVHDLTVEFCNRFVEDRTNRTYGTNRTWDQMTQAARSGKQNIAEGSQASGTSKKTELKLINVARASLEELLIDFEDFLRQRKLQLWKKDDPRILELRKLAYKPDRTHETYRSYMTYPESTANTMICLIHQTNFLLDRLKSALEKDFLEKGGFTERLYRKRTEFRKS